MTQLTDFNPLRIVQSSHQPTATTWDSLDHLLIVLPEAPTSDAFLELPQGDRLERVLDRARAAGVDYPTSRLNNSRATGITLATRTDGTAFGGLTWARKCIARCLAERPGQLGIVTAGFDNQAREKLVRDLAAAALAAAFELPRFKSEKTGARKLRRVRFLASGPRVDLSSIQAQALGNNIARWFTALPPNELDAATYPRLMEALCETHGIAVEILDESRLAKLGAHAFLAVSQGNRNRDAGIVRLRYRPTGAGRAELILVGKGILFDTGGTNLKPFKSMLDMHIDMQGSAVALGTLIALATLQVPYSVDAWLAVTENRISATAYKPQDVIRAANGKTIQVIHTDAEGRMVLADTLALAAREEAAVDDRLCDVDGGLCRRADATLLGRFQQSQCRQRRFSGKPVRVRENASGPSPWTRTTTRCCAATSRTSNNAPRPGTAITFSPPGSCPNSCRTKFRGYMWT